MNEILSLLKFYNLQDSLVILNPAELSDTSMHKLMQDKNKHYIFCHEIEKRPDAVIGYIHAIIGKEFNLSVYEENYKIHVNMISTLEAKRFLNKNHVMGYAFCECAAGIYIYDQLISVMTFKKTKGKDNICWEINRFCDINDTTVHGSFAELRECFSDNYPQSLRVITHDRLPAYEIDTWHGLGSEKGFHRTEKYYFHKNELITKYARSKAGKDVPVNCYGDFLKDYSVECDYGISSFLFTIPETINTTISYRKFSELSQDMMKKLGTSIAWSDMIEYYGAIDRSPYHNETIVFYFASDSDKLKFEMKFL